jgi:hypothetical protein
MESLIFKGLTARRLYKSFGVKGLVSGKGRLESNEDKAVDGEDKRERAMQTGC